MREEESQVTRVVIEFSGIDGSGKSTQMDLLTRWCNGQGLRCYECTIRTVGRRLLSTIAADHGHRCLEEMFDVGSVELGTALEVFGSVYATIAPIDFGSDHVVITSTYSRYWLASACASVGDDVPGLAAIYNRLPAPGLSIHLDVSAATAYDRILARPRGDYLLHSGGFTRLQQLHTAYRAVDSIVKYPSSHVSSETDVEETFSAITRLVQESLGREASGSNRDAGDGN
jgi:thymidylate kinase